MQPGYLPWSGYFNLVECADVFVLYDDVQFDSGSWRNRNRILNKGAPQWLTVPVQRNFPQLIRDVQIVDTNWPQKHLKTLAQLYARAPGFEHCYPAIDSYLTARKYRWLVDLCLEGHRVLAGLLGISTPIHLSSELNVHTTGQTERLVAICEAMSATEYLSAEASRSYMKPELWSKSGISLTYQDYPAPEYPQFGDQFVDHLSIVDTLMFLGADARSTIGRKSNREH